MFKNMPLKSQQFLFEWSLVNLFGWIMGLGVAFKIRSNIGFAYEFSFYKSMLVWLPLGIIIGVFQWFMLRRFGINLLLWIFATALGFSISFSILYGAYDLNRFDLNLIPQGRIDLGFIGKIDIGRNIATLLSSVGFLLGGLITSVLQAVLLRKIISKPWLWIRASLLGFLPVLILPVAYFFKRIGLHAIYFIGGYFFYMIAGALLDILMVPVLSIGISLHTGKVILEQSNSDVIDEAG
jgi:hypothetical protein